MSFSAVQVDTAYHSTLYFSVSPEDTGPQPLLRVSIVPNYRVLYLNQHDAAQIIEALKGYVVSSGA